MKNASIELVHGVMVGRLISNVRVRITRYGYANYIDKKHHEISADMLERKFGIVIDKTKLTLQSTTLDNVRSSLKTSTWW